MSSINESVGQNGKNAKEDVRTIQVRLNYWIKQGKLPDITELVVDGLCGSKTKKAIGAFQTLYLGSGSADRRVDPNGKTLEALFQSTLWKQVSDALYQAWLKAQAAAAQAPPPPPDIDWVISAKEVGDIRKNFGENALAWARLPPKGTEVMEFYPQKNTDRIGTLFGWKSQTPNTACVANPKQHVQFLEMLRDDMPFWVQRSGGHNRAAIIFQYNAACVIKDYRGFIMGQKMCPKSAYYRLVGINKDVIFNMFVGMFQLLSPMGLANAASSSGNIAEILNKMSEGITGIKWDDNKSMVDNLRNFKWPWMK